MDNVDPPFRPRLVSGTLPPEPSHRLLLRLARRGAGQSGSLTAQQTADVCRALLAIYAQMGIG